MKGFLKVIGSVLLALFFIQNILYWQDPVYWRRYYVSFFHMGNVGMDFFKPYVVIGSEKATALPAALPGSKTISSTALEDMVSYAESFDSFALIVVQGGEVQLEWYNHGHQHNSLTQSQSMHKTLQAALVGAAIADGFIASVDEPIATYLPEWQNDTRGEITIHQLLTMASGLEQYGFSLSPFSKSFSWLYASDRAPILFATRQLETPGLSFDYNDINAQLLGIIVSRASAKNYADYLNEKLWQPLGAETSRIWLDHEGGMAMSACCLLSPAMNWARVGLLLKDEGRFNGRRLLPSEWVNAMITPNGLTPHYGLQTWLASDIPNPRGDSSGFASSEAFLADDIVMLAGYGGQRVYISRQKDLVIVRMGPSAGPRPLKKGWDNARLVNTAISGMQGNGDEASSRIARGT